MNYSERCSTTTFEYVRNRKPSGESMNTVCKEIERRLSENEKVYVTISYIDPNTDEFENRC